MNQWKKIGQQSRAPPSEVGSVLKPLVNQVQPFIQCVFPFSLSHSHFTLFLFYLSPACLTLTYLPMIISLFNCLIPPTFSFSPFIYLW